MAISTGILGLNARNYIYIRTHNKRRAKQRADDKVQTKKALLKKSIPTSGILTVFENRNSIRDFDWELPEDGFVVKPARGYGGEGILVFTKWFGEYGETITGKKLTRADVESHLFDILDGVYSLQYLPDTAYIEELIHPDPFYKKLTSVGLPDIRVIVYNKVPVMAMTRVPSEESEGKANIHQGAAAIGIDIRSGVTFHALTKKANSLEAQNFFKKIIGIKIPNWETILLLASRAQEASGLGYAGVDIVIDQKKGPLVLEINARPGLSIQLANHTSLRTRLERLENLDIPTPERGVEVAMSLFTEQEVAKDAEKPKIIKVVEEVTFHVDGEEKKYFAKIDTGAFRTSLDFSLVKELNLTPIDKTYTVKSANGIQVRNAVKVKFTLQGKTISTNATIIDRKHLKYPMIVGRRDLKGFLVTPILPPDQEDPSQEDDDDEEFPEEQMVE